MQIMPVAQLLSCTYFAQFCIDSTEEVSRNILLDLSERITRNRLLSVGHRLNLRDVEVENIVHDYRRSGSNEQIYQVLRTWKDQNGRRATKTILAHALWDAGCYEAARHVQ